jgi:hypothetical protein
VVEWDDISACRGQYLDDFYPENNVVLKSAKDICTECPVRQACLIASIPERHGMWAGLTMSDRQRMRSRENIVLAPNDEDVAAYRRAAREGWRTGDYLAALGSLLPPSSAARILEVLDVGPQRAA